VQLGLPLPLAIAASVLATAGIAALLELLTVRPIADGDPLRIIMVTIGGSVVLRQFAQHLFGPDELPLPPFSAGASMKIGGAAIELQTLWIWGITFAAVVGLVVLYRRTSLGKAMRATAIQRDAARLVDEQAQHSLPAGPLELDLHQFKAHCKQDRFGKCANPFTYVIPMKCHDPFSKQKK
jgi:branched-chain amino acid transport system permease protein